MAILFDGVDDLVSCGSAAGIDNLSSKSISIWFRTGSTLPASKSDLVAKLANSGFGGGWTLEYETTGVIDYFNFFSGSGYGGYKWESASETIAINTLYHVVITFNNAGSSGPDNDPIIYVNGSSVSLSQTGSAGGSRSSDAAGDFTIGGRQASLGFGNQTVDGHIYECALWSSILTSGNVTTLYNSGKYNYGKPLSVDSGNLISLWGFQDGADGTSADGDTVADSVGSNTGTGIDGANNTGLTWSGEDYLASIQTINSQVVSPVKGITVLVNSLGITSSLNQPSISSSINVNFLASPITGAFNQPSVSLSGSSTKTVIVSPLTLSGSIQSVTIVIAITTSAQSITSSIQTPIMKGTITPNALSQAMSLVSPVEEVKANISPNAIVSNLTNRVPNISVLPSNLNILTALTIPYVTGSVSLTVSVASLSALFNLYDATISVPVRQVLISTKHGQSRNVGKVNRSIRFTRNPSNKSIVKSEHYYQTGVIES